MKIKSIAANNFRTLEEIEIRFDHYYTAICGKNNSGKSNLIRIIQNVFSHLDFPFHIDFGDYSFRNEINRKKDLTAWKTKENPEISIGIEFEINSKDDAGIFKFISEFILKKSEKEGDESNHQEINSLIVIFKIDPKTNKRIVEITFNETKIEDSFQKEEILRKLRSSSCSIFHNSTKHVGADFPFRKGYDTLNEFLTEDDKEQIEKKKNSLVTTIKSKLKKQQKEFQSFLGRLEDKYDVGLSISEPNLDKSSINISLKEKGVDVNLDDWGSGTRNRTLIFLKLLNAKRVKISELEDKTTPFVIIEEPESFLHPSAQAEFGRILQDIAEEFQIQVIVTTHSPYLLNHKQAKSNILLKRKIERSKKLRTEIVDTTGENWYEPFALTLGINGSDFGPLKDFIFSSSDSIILVEGDTDKKYLEILKDSKHGNKKLKFDGEIFSYGGADNLKNNVILRFIKGRFSKFLITVDKDRFNDVKKSFESVGLKEGKTYITIGKPDVGKQNIEGLLPANILAKVYSENPDLVQVATSNTKDKKSAQSSLKSKLLEEFDKNKEYSEEYFGEFYKLTNKVNKVFE